MSRQRAGGFSAYSAVPQADASPGVPSSREERPPYADSPVQEQGIDLSRARDESSSVPDLYETWVELDHRVKQARVDLQTVLAARQEAAILRRRAQKVLDEGEDIRQEAQRMSEAAWRTFDLGLSVSAKGLPERWRTIREIDEAMKTYTVLQRATYGEAWKEADRTRQRATTELLKALTALSTAVFHADRELKETANLPAAADFLKLSAEEELHCAEAIRNEILNLGREALSELDLLPASTYSQNQEIPVSVSQELTVPPHPAPEALREPSSDAPVEPAISTRPVSTKTGDAAEKPSEAQEAQPSEPWEYPQAATDLRAAPEPVVSQTRDTPIEWHEEGANAPTASTGPGEQLHVEEPAEPEEFRAEPGIGTAAEQLVRELEAARLRSQPTESPVEPGAQEPSGEAPPGLFSSASPGSNAAILAQELQKELASLRAAQGASEAPPAASPEGVEGEPAKTYSGRLYLMFPSSLSQGRLESVWEVLEQVAGGGNIADTRLISRDAGIQFTLDLGQKVLDIDDLRARIPRAELVALGEDRLRIDWPN